MSKKNYGKSQEVCQAIIDQFKNGELPETLTQIFVKRSDEMPSAKWSWNNQLLKALSGTYDARGFKQWLGRRIRRLNK